MLSPALRYERVRRRARVAGSHRAALLASWFEEVSGESQDGAVLDPGRAAGSCPAVGHAVRPLAAFESETDRGDKERRDVLGPEDRFVAAEVEVSAVGRVELSGRA